MFALLLALSCGIAAGLVSHFALELSPFWSGIIGFVVILGTQVTIALLIRKRIAAINGELQSIMLEGQKKMNQQVQQFQSRPQGSLKIMQKVIEKLQEDSIRRGLTVLDEMDRFSRWNIMLGRQVNSLRLQFYYQLKDFEKVDELIPKSLFIDGTAVAMRIARMFRREDPKLDAYFKKKIRKFSGDQAILLYALYSWILVKQGRLDDAIKVLVKAKDSTDNEVLKRNWEALVNGKEKRFSNSGLGEAWYVLQLEEPKMVKQQQKRVRNVFR